jgi:restriction endonuclease S subunit
VRIGDVYSERSERGAEDMELLSVTMNDGVKMRSDIEGKDNSSEDKSNYKIVRAGDMVYNSMRMWQGANGISPWDGIVSPAYTVLKPRIPISNGFFAALFKTHRLINEFRKNSQGMTSDTWNLKYPQIETIKTCIPALAEQEKIADFLMALDQRIEKQRTLVEHLKKYKRGVSIAIFDRKISLTKNNPSWIKTTVGEICKITMGQSPDSESYNTDQIGIPLVQGNADMKNCITCPQRYTSKPTKICEKGSIILSVRAPVGSVGRADRTVCLGRGVCAINSDNNDFLYYFFERNEPYWKRIEQGGTFTAISGDDIADMPIDYPSLEERQKIADFLLKIDTHIAVEENTLNQLVALKSGLLQQLFI